MLKKMKLSAMQSHYYTMFCCLFGDRVTCSLGWPQTRDIPDLPSQVPGLQGELPLPGSYPFLAGAGVKTQGFTLARQAFYDLIHSHNLFYSNFGDRVSLFAQAGLNCDLPILCFPLLLGQ
jgi:hypothetical protein